MPSLEHRKKVASEAREKISKEIGILNRYLYEWDRYENQKMHPSYKALEAGGKVIFDCMYDFEDINHEK